MPVPDSEGADEEGLYGPPASGHQTPLTALSALEMPPVPESPLPDDLSPSSVPTGSRPQAEPRGSSVLIDTRTPTPPASGRASAHSALMTEDASSDSGSRAREGLSPNAAPQTVPEWPGFEMARAPPPPEEEEYPLLRPWGSPAMPAQEDRPLSELESFDLHDAEVSARDPCASDIFEAAREPNIPAVLPLKLPPLFTPAQWYQGAPIGDWPSWAEVPGLYFQTHTFMEPLTVAMDEDKCVREHVAQVSVTLAHLYEAWTDAFMGQWLAAARSITDAYLAGGRRRYPFPYVDATPALDRRVVPVVTEHQLRLIIDVAAQRDCILAALLILMTSFGMTARAGWLYICGPGRVGLPYLNLTEPVEEVQIPPGYWPIVPLTVAQVAVVCRAQQRRPPLPGLTGQKQLEASLQGLLPDVWLDPELTTPIRIEGFAILALYWHAHYGRISRHVAVTLACGRQFEHLEQAVWWPLEAAMGQLLMEHALCCPNFDHAPVAPLPAEYQPFFAMAPLPRRVVLRNAPVDVHDAEAAIRAADETYGAMLLLRVDQLIRENLYEHEFLGDRTLADLERLTDQCLLRGAPPQHFVAVSRCLFHYMRDADPFHVHERAMTLWYELNEIIADRARWWASDIALPPIGHIIIEFETRFCRTHPHVVLAVVLSWHYGAPLHVALTLSRFSFRRGHADDGIEDMTLLVTPQEVRPPLSDVPIPAAHLLHSVLSARTGDRSDMALLPMPAPMLEELFEALFADIARPQGMHEVPSLQQLHGLAIGSTDKLYARFDEHDRAARRAVRER